MLNPWMLIGLAGLAVPVILHLIQRQKLQPHLLATLRFLDPGYAANAFKPVPRDLLQLLLRLLLLTLFVLLMARLLLPAPTTGPRALVVILDQSMSMQRNQPDGRTLFEACRGQLLDLIGGMRRDDRLSLMLVGDTLAAETGFLADPQRLRQAAEGFAPGEAGGSALLPAITRAVRQLSGRREVNSAVIVFTDRQAVNFSRARDADELRAALARGRVQVVLVGEAVLGADNLAIEEAAFTPAQVHLGAGGRLTATEIGRAHV